MDKLSIQPVSEVLWPSVEQLFGKSGACNGCWCMYWRIGPAYHKRSRDLNKEDLRKVIGSGAPVGLIAFVDGEPAGWCQLTSRDDLFWLVHNGYGHDHGGLLVWCLSCFYIKSRYRGMGLMGELVNAAIQHAREGGARILEAYPRDSNNSFTGYPQVFKRAGFREAGDAKFNRKVFVMEL